MLELKGITKCYKTGNSEVFALNNVSISFRNSEFVAILGPSGSGKTTLLNIIGGLDRYDSGDLVINSRSTKQYKDKDWDGYRNHSIGFVFQNYNLIPHQTVLSNVELALTLSGVSKRERRRRAKEVLEKVGLGDQLNKKPTQMSGGQMQRVAIARALINDPDILLADEPTGALDSGTSEQIMELIREISKDRLVIMVTHNPEIAEEYANRIINIKDGKICNDSNPYTVSVYEESEKIKNEKNNKQRTSMDFGTALSLSFNNLLTKKGRTLITSFAGSIGIIGIALILSLSNGMQAYISSVERDTLASYPITIEAETYDIMQLLGAAVDSDLNIAEHGSDKIYMRPMLQNSAADLQFKAQQNDMGRFKQYIEQNSDVFKPLCTDIKYGYDIDLQIFKSDTSQSVTRLRPNDSLEKFGLTTDTDVWEEVIGDAELLDAQYDILAGEWPQNYNELVLFLDENNEIDDITLYALGLADVRELNYAQSDVSQNTQAAIELESYGYDEFLGLKFKLVPSSYYYHKNGDVWDDMSKDEVYMKGIVDASQELEIVAIARPKSTAKSVVEAGTVGYMSGLTEYIMNVANKSEIVKQQMANTEVDVFTGLAFEETDTTYEDNMKLLGAADSDAPATISLYPRDFASKERIVEIIEEYNEVQINEGREEATITYTDYVNLIMSSLTQFIDIIKYGLMAFVSISLVVSSIMIGIITYISVLERTKEIGILRSIGASKKDISRVFNSESIIIGLASGLMGIIMTLLINIPINIIVKAVLDIPNLAALPFLGAVILIGISVGLTLIAGFIPSRVAAKKDPVQALRSE